MLSPALESSELLSVETVVAMALASIVDASCMLVVRSKVLCSIILVTTLVSRADITSVVLTAVAMALLADMASGIVVTDITSAEFSVVIIVDSEVVITSSVVDASEPEVVSKAVADASEVVVASIVCSAVVVCASDGVERSTVSVGIATFKNSLEYVFVTSAETIEESAIEVATIPSVVLVGKSSMVLTVVISKVAIGSTELIVRLMGATNVVGSAITVGINPNSVVAANVVVSTA